MINTTKLNELKTIWTSLFNSTITEQQWKVWMFINDYDTLIYGLQELAKKYQQMDGKMTQNHQIRYMSACMANRKRQEDK